MSHEGDVRKIRQRLHAKKRALQRYGLRLTTIDLKEIGALIREKPLRNAKKLLGSNLRRIKLWKVTYKGLELPIAYDSKTQTVASILPPRALEKYNNGLLCQYCSQECVCIPQLIKHIKSKHKELSVDQIEIVPDVTKSRGGIQKIIVCGVCGKWATSESGLEEHKRAKHGITIAQS